MVEKWKLALKEFLKQYEEDDNVIGAILCGSYAHGMTNDDKDIDVQLLLKNGNNLKEVGIVEKNSYLIEYHMETYDSIKSRMKKEHENGISTISKIFGYGKVIYDIDDKVKELQKMALDYIDKPFSTITDYKLNLNNYYIWDYLDKLKLSLSGKSGDFRLIYYKLLYDIYNIYAEYLSITKLPETKIYKILSNNIYRKNYSMFKFPEEEFIKLYLKCFDDTKEDTMYKNIEELINYYYKKQGGFNIRRFKLRKENIKENE